MDTYFSNVYSRKTSEPTLKTLNFEDFSKRNGISFSGSHTPEEIFEEYWSRNSPASRSKDKCVECCMKISHYVNNIESSYSSSNYENENECDNCDTIINNNCDIPTSSTSQAKMKIKFDKLPTELIESKTKPNYFADTEFGQTSFGKGGAFDLVDYFILRGEREHCIDDKFSKDDLTFTTKKVIQLEKCEKDPKTFFDCFKWMTPVFTGPRLLIEQSKATRTSEGETGLTVMDQSPTEIESEGLNLLEIQAIPDPPTELPGTQPDVGIGIVPVEEIPDLPDLPDIPEINIGTVPVEEISEIPEFLEEEIEFPELEEEEILDFEDEILEPEEEIPERPTSAHYAASYYRVNKDLTVDEIETETDDSSDDERLASSTYPHKRLPIVFMDYLNDQFHHVENSKFSNAKSFDSWVKDTYPGIQLSEKMDSDNNFLSWYAKSKEPKKTPIEFFDHVSKNLQSPQYDKYRRLSSAAQYGSNFSSAKPNGDMSSKKRKQLLKNYRKELKEMEKVLIKQKKQLNSLAMENEITKKLREGIINSEKKIEISRKNITNLKSIKDDKKWIQKLREHIDSSIENRKSIREQNRRLKELHKSTSEKIRKVDKIIEEKSSSSSSSKSPKETFSSCDSCSRHSDNEEEDDGYESSDNEDPTSSNASQYIYPRGWGYDPYLDQYNDPYYDPYTLPYLGLGLGLGYGLHRRGRGFRRFRRGPNFRPRGGRHRHRGHGRSQRGGHGRSGRKSKSRGSMNYSSGSEEYSGSEEVENSDYSSGSEEETIKSPSWKCELNPKTKMWVITSLESNSESKEKRSVSDNNWKSTAHDDFFNHAYSYYPKKTSFHEPNTYSKGEEDSGIFSNAIMLDYLNDSFSKANLGNLDKVKNFDDWIKENVEENSFFSSDPEDRGKIDSDNSFVHWYASSPAFRRNLDGYMNDPYASYSEAFGTLKPEFYIRGQVNSAVKKLNKAIFKLTERIALLNNPRNENLQKEFESLEDQLNDLKKNYNEMLRLRNQLYFDIKNEIVLRGETLGEDPEKDIITEEIKKLDQIGTSSSKYGSADSPRGTPFERSKMESLRNTLTDLLARLNENKKEYVYPEEDQGQYKKSKARKRRGNKILKEIKIDLKSVQQQLENTKSISSSEDTRFKVLQQRIKRMPAQNKRYSVLTKRLNKTIELLQKIYNVEVKGSFLGKRALARKKLTTLNPNLIERKKIKRLYKIIEKTSLENFRKRLSTQTTISRGKAQFKVMLVGGSTPGEAKSKANAVQASLMQSLFLNYARSSINSTRDGKYRKMGGFGDYLTSKYPNANWTGHDETNNYSKWVKNESGFSLAKSNEENFKNFLNAPESSLMYLNSQAVSRRKLGDFFKGVQTKFKKPKFKLPKPISLRRTPKEFLSQRFGSTAVTSPIIKSKFKSAPLDAVYLSLRNLIKNIEQECVSELQDLTMSEAKVIYDYSNHIKNLFTKELSISIDDASRQKIELDREDRVEHIEKFENARRSLSQFQEEERMDIYASLAWVANLTKVQPFAKYLSIALLWGDLNSSRPSYLGREALGFKLGGLSYGTDSERKWDLELTLTIGYILLEIKKARFLGESKKLNPANTEIILSYAKSIKKLLNGKPFSFLIEQHSEFFSNGSLNNRIREKFINSVAKDYYDDVVESVFLRFETDIKITTNQTFNPVKLDRNLHDYDIDEIRDLFAFMFYVAYIDTYESKFLDTSLRSEVKSRSKLMERPKGGYSKSQTIKNYEDLLTALSSGNMTTITQHIENNQDVLYNLSDDLPKIVNVLNTQRNTK